MQKGRNTGYRKEWREGRSAFGSEAQAGHQAGLGRSLGRLARVAGRPPGRCWPVPWPVGSGGRPATRPVLAGPLAGWLGWLAGPQAGFGRSQGRFCLSAWQASPALQRTGRPSSRFWPAQWPVGSGVGPAIQPVLADLTTGFALHCIDTYLFKTAIF